MTLNCFGLCVCLFVCLFHFRSDLEESSQIVFLHKRFFFQLSDGFGLRLQIWDTAGQERFRCLIPSYLRDCHVILVCFDVTNCCTLDNVPDWIELAQKERFGRIKKPLIVLVGNKVDEVSQRQVSTGAHRFPKNINLEVGTTLILLIGFFCCCCFFVVVFSLQRALFLLVPRKFHACIAHDLCVNANPGPLNHHKRSIVVPCPPSPLPWKKRSGCYRPSK